MSPVNLVTLFIVLLESSAPDRVPRRLPFATDRVPARIQRLGRLFHPACVAGPFRRLAAARWPRRHSPGRIGAMLLLLVTGTAVAAQDAAPPAADTVVERLESALIDNMRAGAQRDFARRYEQLRPMMDQIMAAERMARYIFGRAWRDFDEDQQARFRERFLDLSAATYAGQFSTDNGERFEPIEVQHQAEDRALVRRQLITGSGRKVAFDYLMTLEGGQWRIVTIVTNGVSDLAVKRGQYQRILDQQGFDGILEHLRESIEKQRER
jgi:phospholipid transport system substrate-binding protein